MAELQTTTDMLFEEISKLIAEARQRVSTAVNTTMVNTYYEIGKYIVEDEQHSERRAAYGKKVLPRLAERLTQRFGKGWSSATLTNCRKFYLVYRIPYAEHTKSDRGNSVCSAYEIPKFALSWNHYQILMRIKNPDERHFYEIEARKQGGNSV